jgi:hypothetical protein
MAIRLRKVLGGAQPPRALAPARAQAACQGVDRHLSKPPTFTARWRRSANRVVKGPSPKGTATARLRRFLSLGCPRLKASNRPYAVRLQLHVLAYNLGNFMRTLAMPKATEPWSLTSLREISTGGSGRGGNLGLPNAPKGRFWHPTARNRGNVG